MPGLEKRDRDAVRGLRDEIERVDLGGASIATTVLPRVAELVEADNAAVYSLRDRTGQWLLERFDATGATAPAEPLMRELFHTGGATPVLYNPAAPLAAHSNRVIDASVLIDELGDAWASSPMNVRVCTPLGLQRHHHVRALICDGPRLLAWFGTMTERAPTGRQLGILQALVPAMRKRLALEEQLVDLTYVRPALGVVLDRVGGPAYVVDARAGIHEMNVAGRELLALESADVRAALGDALAGRANAFTFELVDICDSLHGPLRLAVLRMSSIEERLVACVRVCVQTWTLTPRQAEVLALLVRGLSNATVAAALGCTERTVEMHVTALLDRAGVDSRSALISRVLTTFVG